MPNLKLKQKKNLSSFRRIAIGTWKTVGDPSVYGSLTLKMGKALEYLDRFREVTGKRVTLSHMMAKAVASVLEKMPDANAILRWNRIYLRDDIGVFFQVAMNDPVTGEIDLSGATIHSCNTKNLEQIYDDFAGQVEKVRAGKDKELENTRSTFKKIPFFLLNFVLTLIGFLAYTLNLNLKWAGVPNDAFGSVMVTNIGVLGLEEAYVPLVPYSRVPLLIAMGAVKDDVVIVDGEVKVEKVMKLFATFDHRVLDGTHAAIMAKTLKTCFENPFEFFDSLEGRSTATANESLED
ncbi:MAG: 2-oxo acid dehydrogenase [Deltaproteobacteria bacterium CG_4_9_14_3_um_filter_63_12]|nr:MAG: 2-oxo acid dehydrogenase [Deltaproteobacteria bacterium CG17_big_fil_post_rev_8_21_14_2_50_63_7]PJB48168.1 MAG: 2-oxo acid dehydrogenase [Deltaproteobacteria bacterium CG_4_9_14_3_um_filter_63_12]